MENIYSRDVDKKWAEKKKEKKNLVRELVGTVRPRIVADVFISEGFWMLCVTVYLYIFFKVDALNVQMI